VNRYVLAADEVGTPGMAPGTSSSFVFGGYVVSEADVPRAVNVWRAVKAELCETADVELKWKHLIVDADDPRIEVPLLAKDPCRRRQLAASALDRLFGSAPIIPVVAVSRKDRATDLFIVQSRKGKDKIDDDLMWLGPVAKFALFLGIREATGKLWFDRLGSERHETRRQETWSEQLAIARAGGLPSEVQKSLQQLVAIDQEIEFLDSAQNEAIQIADFVCGVIWQAAEGDEAFLARLIDRYGPSATREGLGILHIE
jgi:hypothetical protein